MYSMNSEPQMPNQCPHSSMTQRMQYSRKTENDNFQERSISMNTMNRKYSSFSSLSRVDDYSMLSATVNQKAQICQHSLMFDTTDRLEIGR